MVETTSTMLQLRTKVPEFSLPDADSGENFGPMDFASAQALLVMFICNHCPFVLHVIDELTQIAAEYQNRGVDVIAINSNSVETHPQDGPEHMKELAEEKGWEFPFLFDESQEVAKEFQAACTPDLFVFGSDHRLLYRGQLDDSRPGNDVPVTGADLRAALDAALEGRAISEAEQKPSLGCNIKWTPGNEPEYFG
jgi:peroxiredoxin